MKKKRTLVDLMESAANPMGKRGVLNFQRRPPQATTSNQRDRADLNSDDSYRLLTYAELWQKSTCVAAELFNRGLRRGHYAVLTVDDGETFLTALWACLRLGVAVAPMPGLAPGAGAQTRRERLVVAIRLLSAPVICGRAGAAAIRPLLTTREGPIVIDDLLLEGADLRTAELILAETSRPEGDDLAVVQFSSGSTADPKGVLITHAQAVANVEAKVRREGTGSDDRLGSWFPYYHDFGLFGSHFTAVCAGIDEVRLEPEAFGRRPLAFLDMIQSCRITQTYSTNTGLNLILRALDASSRGRRNAVGGGMPSYDLSSVRLLALGAEMISHTVLERFAQAMEPYGLDRRCITPGYGLAEAVLLVSGSPAEGPRTLTIERDSLSRRDLAVPVNAASSSQETDGKTVTIVSAGYPLTDLDVRIGDVDGAALPAYHVGRIFMRGSSVTAGYVGNPAATAAARTPDGWFDTGDLGFRDDDGRLFITGRAKEVMIRNGQNIYPHTVEQIAAGVLGGKAREIVACGTVDAESGIEELIVFYVPAARTLTLDQETIDQLRGAVANAAGVQVDGLVPIRGGDIPRTSSGKIRRSALIATFKQRIGSQAALRASSSTPNRGRDVLMSYSSQGQTTKSDLPADDALLRGIWRDALERSAGDPIPDHASFFALGGDSLRALRLQASLEERVGRKLPADFVHRMPTLPAQRTYLRALREGHHNPPANDLEALMRDMAAHAFGVENTDDLSVTEPLIVRAGGIDAAMRFAEDIRTVFGKKDGRCDVLALPSVRDMASEIESDRSHTGSPMLELMPFQETLYYHRNSVMRNEPTGLSCYIVYRFDLEGEVKTHILEAAFDELIRRHDMLRAEIDDSGDAPRLRIRPSLPPFRIRYEDLSDLTADQRASRLAAIDQEDHDHRCDLAAAPLFYARVLLCGPDRSTVTIHIDHMLIDGFSFLRLSHELFRIYDSLALGEPLPALPPRGSAHFADYVRLANLRRRTREYAANLEMHLALYRDLPPKLSLPMRMNPALLKEVRFATYHDQADPDVMSKLDTWCRSTPGVSLNAVLLAALFKLINLWSNQDDLIINMPIFNREHYMPAARDVVGSFIDIMPVRLKTSSSEPLATMARRVEAFNRRLLTHPVSSIELSRLVAQRERVQGAMSSIIFSSSMNLVREDDLVLRTLNHAAPPRVHTGAPGTWIDLVLYNVGTKSCHLDWNYVRDLFDEAFVATLAEQYRAILAGFAAAVSGPHRAERSFNSISAMTESHRALLEQINDTDRHYPITTLPQWIGTAVARNPDAVALSFEDQEVSYRQFDDYSNRVAHFLRAAGVARGSFVALALPRGVDLLICQLGAMKAGAAYVPIDPTYPPDRIGYMVEDSQAKVLVLDPTALADPSADVGKLAECPDLEHILFLDGHRGFDPVGTVETRQHLHRRVDLQAYSIDAVESGVTPDDLAYMIYTSGSTGKPKGVMITHRSFCNFIDHVVRAFARGPDERFALVTSPSFDMTLASNCGPFLIGASLHILSEDRTRNVAELLTFLADKKISLLNVTPSHFALLAAALPYLDAKPDLVNHMRILLGGEVINPADLNIWLERYPTHEIVNEYGPTEATVASTFFPIPVRNGRCELAMVPIGKPIQNTRMYILNEDNQPCMIGVAGRLFIGGDGVAKGYWRKDEQTARAFVPDIFDGRPGRKKMYDTGDMARWLEDGNIQFLGRNDRQVNLRGFRIELGEIETALLSHDDVVAAAVTLRQDESGQSSLAAFYVEADREREALSQAELRTYLAERLPEYMLPASFRRLDAMPLTPSGKLDLKALPVDGTTFRSNRAADFVAPRGELETRIAGIWRSVLGLDRVGIKDVFWDIGGDSIRAIRLIRALNDAGLKVGLQDMFRHGTVAELARHLTAMTPAAVQGEVVDLHEAERAKLRLLCLPYSGGSPLMFRDLCGRLPGHVRLSAAHYPGVDGRETPLKTIDAVADAFIGSLREAADVPTVLLGYCYGGYIAHALALRAEREGLPLVGLILTGATPPGAKDKAYGRDALAGGLEDPENMRRLRRIYAPLLSHMTADEQNRYWTLFRTSVEALRDYDFGDDTLSTPCVVLTGQDEEYPYIHEFNDSWRRCFSRCDFRSVPGGHLMMQTHPATFAQALQDALADLLAGQISREMSDA